MGLLGSPPQVRGKRRYGSGLFRHDRITPAGAGKTKTSLEVISSCQDHPRRCGENTQYLRQGTTETGSPPQVRGKRAGSRTTLTKPGITPAGAGKTPPRLRPYAAQMDHPRRCGENILPLPKFQCLSWITPAGAGKTYRL